MLSFCLHLVDEDSGWLVQEHAAKGKQNAKPSLDIHVPGDITGVANAPLSLCRRFLHSGQERGRGWGWGSAGLALSAISHFQSLLTIILLLKCTCACI